MPWANTGSEKLFTSTGNENVKDKNTIKYQYFISRLGLLRDALGKRKSPRRIGGCFFLMVPKAGIEPARPEGIGF